MDIKDKIPRLKSFSIFKDLSDRELLSVSEFIHYKLLPPKTIFIFQDDQSDSIYFIIRGLTRAFRDTPQGQEVNLSLLGEGETIGEMGIIEELPRSATVETIKETEVFILTKANFINLLKRHPEISINLLVLLSRRLRNFTRRVENIMSKKMEERTLESLKILSQFFKEGEILFSHEELAVIIGATRARVTEVLNNLREEGRIELHHRRIKLL